MFQHAVHLGLSEKSPSREKLDSSLIAQEEKQLSSSLLVVYKEFTLRCLKRDPGLSFGTYQPGCIGLYWVGYVGFKVPNGRHGSLFKHQRVGLIW